MKNKLIPLLLLGLFCYTDVIAISPQKNKLENDRQYWTNLFYKISTPILSTMSRGEVKKDMELELSPSWDERNKDVAHRLSYLQALTMLAWQKKRPSEISEGQTRTALTTVMKRMYATPRNFNKSDSLTLRFVGHQPQLSTVYTGSMYITTLAFLPLGLPADDSFWTSSVADWTQKKAWSEQEFPIETMQSNK